MLHPLSSLEQHQTLLMVRNVLRERLSNQLEANLDARFNDAIDQTREELQEVNAEIARIELSVYSNWRQMHDTGQRRAS